MHRLAALLVLAVALSACGSKTPSYLPPTPASFYYLSSSGPNNITRDYFLKDGESFETTVGTTLVRLRFVKVLETTLDRNGRAATVTTQFALRNLGKEPLAFKASDLFQAANNSGRKRTISSVSILNDSTITVDVETEKLVDLKWSSAVYGDQLELWITFNTPISQQGSVQVTPGLRVVHLVFPVKR